MQAIFDQGLVFITNDSISISAAGVLFKDYLKNNIQSFLPSSRLVKESIDIVEVVELYHDNTPVFFKRYDFEHLGWIEGLTSYQYVRLHISGMDDVKGNHWRIDQIVDVRTGSISYQLWVK